MSWALQKIFALGQYQRSRQGLHGEGAGVKKSGRLTGNADEPDDEDWSKGCSNCVSSVALSREQRNENGNCDGQD